MKKILIVAMAAFGLMSIASCGGPDTPPEPPKPSGPKTCQVTNNATVFTSAIGADGTMYDAKVIFYNGTTEMSELPMGNLTHSGGLSAILTAPEEATQARVAFLLLPSTNTDPANVMQYTVDYFTLTAGSLLSISITDQTMLTSTKGAMKGGTMTFAEALAQF